MCQAELRLQSPLQKLSEQVMIEQNGQEKTEDLKYVWLVHPYINLEKTVNQIISVLGLQMIKWSHTDLLFFGAVTTKFGLIYMYIYICVCVYIYVYIYI